MTCYVVGLAFSPTLREVLLIRKKRPEWQAGRLNGPGGRVEDGESPLQAMRREFREECGGVDVERWQPVVLLRQNGGRDEQVWFFRVTLTHEQCKGVGTSTDELVEWRNPRLHDKDWMPNLRWIVPLCLDPCCVLPVEVVDAPSVERDR